MDSRKNPPEMKVYDHAIAEALAKTYVHTCMRYRLFHVDPTQHAWLIDKLLGRELTRLRELSDTPNQITQLKQPALRLAGEPILLRGRGSVIGVEFLQHWRGVRPRLDIAGDATFGDAEADGDVRYEFKYMLLRGFRGHRTSSVWGLDGLPGSWQSRMDKATVLLQRLYQQHGDMQGDVEDRLLEAEVRNLKIGEGPDGPSFLSLIHIRRCRPYAGWRSL